MERPKWEYKQETASWQGRTVGLPIDALNRLGSDGWEVCAYTSFADTDGLRKGEPCGWFLFKRARG